MTGRRRNHIDPIGPVGRIGPIGRMVCPDTPTALHRPANLPFAVSLPVRF